MALMRNKEIRSMTAEDLKNKIKELKMESMKNNAQRASKQSAGKVRIIRRTIAKILTALKNKTEKQNKI